MRVNSFSQQLRPRSATFDKGQATEVVALSSAGSHQARLRCTYVQPPPLSTHISSEALNGSQFSCCVCVVVVRASSQNERGN